VPKRPSANLSGQILNLFPLRHQSQCFSQKNTSAS
jgi:hypothetical protein